MKRRPETRAEPLFHAPIPNVFGSGAICWETVQRVDDAVLRGSLLAAGWTMLLGSSFGDHAVSGKYDTATVRSAQRWHSLDTYSANP